MKRFYCTTCKKLKSVKRFPGSVLTPLVKDPMQRIGTCKWHEDKEHGLTHVESIGSKRVRHRVIGMKKISATQQKQKSKKG